MRHLGAAGSTRVVLHPARSLPTTSRAGDGYRRAHVNAGRSEGRAGSGPRLTLKPATQATGYVDGAWWPRSRDLAAELTDLVDALGARLGRVERVAYALSAWDAGPRRIDVAGHPARVEGFSYQDKNIIHLTGVNRVRLSLLVVPPGAVATAGEEAMTTAARQGNADRPEEILAAPAVPAPRTAVGGA
jgi:uncharacterized protein DUF5994